MKFLIDAMLPRELAVQLRSMGFGARHVRALGQSGKLDSDIWSYACREACIVISKDSDFMLLAASDPRTKLILLTSGNASRRQLIEEVCSALPKIIEFASTDGLVLRVGRSSDQT